MDKIPELTEGQKKHLQELFQQNAQKAYIDCLTLADIQGLLTKEASLALKPDNWIEWDNKMWVMHGFDKNSILGFQLVHEDNMVVKIWIGSPNTGTLECNDYETAKTLEKAKQYCQDWLDNHLKERE